MTHPLAERTGSGANRGRILVAAPQPFYEDRGTPIAVLQLLRALSELGYGVDVVTFPLGRTVDVPGLRFFRAGNPFRIKQVPVGFSLRKILLDGGLTRTLMRRLRTGEYACIHAVEEAAFPAAILARRAGIPMLYDMQSCLPEQLAQHLMFRWRPAQGLLARCERWLLNRADLVVSSRGLAEHVRAVAPSARVREWTYVGDHHVAAPEAVAALRRELRIPDGSRVIVYTGTFEPYQGLAELLEGVGRVKQEVPSVVFVLVGGDSAASEVLRRRSNELGLNGNMRLLQRQPRERIPMFLALADVLVSPRAYGGNLPLKIFDYLAAGRPIVATDIPTHRSVLNEERALLVRPNSAEIAGAITQLLLDPVRSQGLAGAAKAYAEENLGWLSFVRAVGELYSEVLLRERS